MKEQKVRKARLHLTISKEVTMPCNIDDLPEEEYSKLIDSYFKELDIHKHNWIEEEVVFYYNDNDEIKSN